MCGGWSSCWRGELSRRGVAACGRRVTLPTAAKSPKRRRGLLRGAPFRCSKSLHPGPHYGGRPPEKLCFISGAQNLTGGSKFPPGHWALGVQNLELLQFHNGAWVFSANAPGAFSPQGRPHVAARVSLSRT